MDLSVWLCSFSRKGRVRRRRTRVSRATIAPCRGTPRRFGSPLFYSFCADGMATASGRPMTTQRTPDRSLPVNWPPVHRNPRRSSRARRRPQARPSWDAATQLAHIGRRGQGRRAQLVRSPATLLLAPPVPQAAAVLRRRARSRLTDTVTASRSGRPMSCPLASESDPSTADCSGESWRMCVGDC